MIKFFTRLLNLLIKPTMSLWPWVIPAATMAAGGALNWLGSQQEEGGYQPVIDPYGGIRKPLLSWLGGQIGQPGKAYGGEMVAPMSEQERQSLDFLKQFGQAGLGKTFGLAKGEITKTLTGDYDPATSPYYQATKAAAARNLAEAQKDIASKAAGGGRYWTGARLERQAEEATDITNVLNTLLGQMAETERQRRLNIIPQALGLAETERQFPLQKATAFQSLGALPRQIQQALDTARYNEWLRSQVQYPMQIAGLASGIQQPPSYEYQQPQQPWWQQMLGGFGQQAGQYGMSNLMSALFS